MHTNRMLSLGAALALMVAAPAAAQQDHQHGQQTGQPGTPGMMGQGMGMAQMMPTGPASLLRAADQLGLTEGQRSQLTGIEERFQEEHTMHVEAAGSQDASAAELLAAQAPDWQAYEVALAEAASHRVKAHVAMIRAASEARAVLTSEQAARLQDAASVMGAMMPGGMEGMMGMMRQAGMCQMMM